MKQLIACALVAGLAAAAPAAAEQKQTEPFDRTIPFSSGGRLKLKNFSGDVRITGSAGEQVVIHAVRRATRERLDNIKLEVEVDGSTIQINANRATNGWRDKNDNVVETEFDIQVPARTALDIDVFSSEVTVTGVEGAQKLNSFSGKLTLQGVTGPIEAQTFSGNIDLDVTRAGEVPELDIETFSGDVKAHIPEQGRARVEFSGFGGDFKSDVPLIYRGGSTRSIKAELGGGGSTRLRFKTFGGSVRLMK
jgi:DUF4097 and DUF4098 domain-containing protein YvlB